MIEDLRTLRRRERHEREQADASDEISARVSHREQARRCAEQIMALTAGQPVR